MVYILSMSFRSALVLTQQLIQRVQGLKQPAREAGRSISTGTEDKNTPIYASTTTRVLTLQCLIHYATGQFEQYAEILRTHLD
jgi:hypothetical protein